jgi:alpha-tubulin suppressor-like RCC1 family protein
MDMGFLARRRGSALILVAILASLTMAITASAQAAPIVVKAWGANSDGQLGDGTTEGPEKCGSEPQACSTTPVEVSKLTGVTEMSAGGGETENSGWGLALLENGTVMAWGRNADKELGNGTQPNSDVPVAVNGLSEVAAISAGPGEHSLALLKNGTVESWGHSFFFGSSHAPEVVSGLSGVKAIAAGRFFSLALLENGTVESWGNNGGKLGDGATEDSETPVNVCAVGTVGPCPTGPYLEGVAAIAASDEHSLALLANGTVVAWGRNNQGQLGNGTETNSDVPVAVNGLSGVKAVSADQSDSLALLGDGTVRAWGANADGQLGDGTSTGPETCGEVKLACSKKPVGVSGLSGVTSIAAGGSNNLALLANGAVMAWGRNTRGQLGDGTSTGPESCPPFADPCSTKPVAVKQAGAVVNRIAAKGNLSLGFGPSGPSANLPEVGRCVKVAVGTGKYSGASCLTLATKPTAKKYEWMPVSVTEKPAFSGSGLETTLTTVGHPTIKCLATNLSGEWSGPKTASVNVEFQGCTTPTGAQCQTVTNPQNKSEIKLSGVVGELGFIRYEEVEGRVTEVVGLDLKPQPPMTSFATYECTGSSEAGHIEGSVIGKITPLNKMTSESKLLYYATKSGEQRPEAFQASPTDTLTTSFTSGVPEESKGSGASSLNIKEYKGQNATPLEIKAK